MVGEQRIDRVTNSIVMFFSRGSERSTPETRYVTCLVSGPLDNKQGRFRRMRRYKDFISTTLTLGAFTPGQGGTTTRSNFCGHSFPIPNNFDEVLTNLYGDYQQLPPPDKQRPTHKIVRFSMEGDRGSSNAASRPIPFT
ncbi:hypothetical protein DBV39_04030 [Orrella marina]|uniref:Uncharacterized protein n=1 Tax=Orrella marina TaxID=2163011 RepID=A0A2R4XGY6_9BURK|nr:hypothetical protein DBV39_04030 [Orrella marina]